MFILIIFLGLFFNSSRIFAFTQGMPNSHPLSSEKTSEIIQDWKIKPMSLPVDSDAVIGMTIHTTGKLKLHDKKGKTANSIAQNLTPVSSRAYRTANCVRLPWHIDSCITRLQACRANPHIQSWPPWNRWCPYCRTHPNNSFCN